MNSGHAIYLAVYVRLGIAHGLGLQRDVIKQAYVVIGGDKIKEEGDVPVARKHNQQSPPAWP